MVIDAYEQKIAETKAVAKGLGSRLEASLIGDRNPSEDKIKEIHALLQAELVVRLNDIFGTEVTIDRKAAEGIAQSIITNSNLRVNKWRIETKARDCATALMEAKRFDPAGILMRGRVYDNAYGDLRKFIATVMPEDETLGYSYASDIMAAANKEVKDVWWEQMTGWARWGGRAEGGAPGIKA